LLIVGPPGKENASPVHIDLSNPKRQRKPTAKVALQAAEESATKLHRQEQARRKMIRAQRNAPDTEEEDAEQEQPRRKMIHQRNAPGTDGEDTESQDGDAGEQDEEDEEVENTVSFFFPPTV
jgi:hypothetical protein